MNSLFRAFLVLVTCLGLTVALAPVGQAASQLETSINVFNVTQNVDGTKVKAKPGDILTYTMKLKNLGPDDLIDYIPQVNMQDLMPYGDITNYGHGGNLEGETFINYPPVLQSATCDCEDTLSFTFNVSDSVCIDNTITDRTFPIVVFEDSGVGINIECTPAPTPTPTPTPEKVTESGPALWALLACTVVGVFGVRRVYQS